MASKIEFDAESHTYVIDGVRIPSVTEIIEATVPKPFERAAWYGWRTARQGTDPVAKRNAAAARGTSVHKALEEWAAGNQPDPFDYPDLDGFLDSLERFVDENDPEFHDSECRTYSLSHGYAGTLDAFVTLRKGKLKGATARFDLKTGRVYPDSAWPQIEAYNFAEIEQGKEPSDIRFILDAKPTGKYRIVKSTDTFFDFQVLKWHYDSIMARKARK